MIGSWKNIKVRINGHRKLNAKKKRRKEEKSVKFYIGLHELPRRTKTVFRDLPLLESKMPRIPKKNSMLAECFDQEIFSADFTFTFPLLLNKTTILIRYLS